MLTVCGFSAVQLMENMLLGRLCFGLWVRWAGLLASGWVQDGSRHDAGVQAEEGGYSRHILRRDHWMQKAGLASPFMACVHVMFINIQMAKESPVAKANINKAGMSSTHSGEGQGVNVCGTIIQLL